MRQNQFTMKDFSIAIYCFVTDYQKIRPLKDRLKCKMKGRNRWFFERKEMYIRKRRDTKFCFHAKCALQLQSY